VLNSPSVRGLVSVQSDPGEIPVASMVKEHDRAVYIFAVSMRDRPTRATFRILRPLTAARVEVLDENRSLNLDGDKLTDNFRGYEVHLYRIRIED